MQQEAHQIVATSGTDVGASVLTVRCGEDSYPIRAEQAEVTIGRASTATIQLDYRWISRSHVALHRDSRGWIASDISSRNGMYVLGTQVDSVRVTDGLVINLGAADGLAVTFSLSDAGEEFGHTDPGVARAGAAVAARRQELGLSQRGLASDRVINAGTLIDFEKGRRWPQARTRSTLESTLGFPRGYLQALRDGTAAAGESTVVRVGSGGGLSGPVSPLARTITLALNGVDAGIESLPAPGSPGFQTRVNTLLVNLDELRAVAEQAAAEGGGAAAGQLARPLASIRQRTDDLIIRAAQDPEAPLGWRLFAARRRYGLAAADVALLAQVSESAITAAEEGRRINPEAAAAIVSLLQHLR